MPVRTRPIRAPFALALAVLLVSAACSKAPDATTTADGATATTAPSPAAAGATAGSGPTTTAPGSPTSSPGGSPTSSAPAKATGAARPSAGCATPGTGTVTPGQGVDQQITTGTETNTYRIYVPPTLTPGTPVPLVLDLHGLGQPHASQALVSGWEQLADQEHLIVLTPQGGQTLPNWRSTTAADNPDTAYLRALIEQTQRDYCVDESRTYSNGISNGGLESSILSCKLSDKIAAVGLVSGIVVPDECKSVPKPVIIFWGKRDCTLPYYGGLGYCLVGPKNGTIPTADAPASGEVPPVEQNVAAWAARNGCAATPTVTQVSEHVEKRTFTGCRDDDAVDFYVVANGGHTWPGSKAAATRDKDPDAPKGITTMEIDATKLIWAFFQQHQLP